MSKYFDNIFKYILEEDCSYYVYVGGRSDGKTIFTTCRFLEFLFGGTCEYHYDPCRQIHHYSLKNDDIGYMLFTITNECFKNENLKVRISKMCEEYDSYMRYEYDVYAEKEKGERRTC